MDYNIDPTCNLALELARVTEAADDGGGPFHGPRR